MSLTCSYSDDGPDARRDAPMTYPALDLIGCAPQWLLRRWYETLPGPRTDEERDVLEAAAVRCEGLGMIEERGGVGVLRG